jgi:hypothetical protein
VVSRVLSCPPKEISAEAWGLRNLLQVFQVNEELRTLRPVPPE